jgi:putative ABC transport system permease protein
MKQTIPIIEILRTAFQALLRNRGRAVLTSLSMVVGTASLVLVVVAGISGRDYTLDLIRGVGTNLIIISNESTDAGTRAFADRLTIRDETAIQNSISEVQSTAPIATSHPTVTIEGITRRISLIGTTPTYQQVRNIEVLQGGRFIDDNDQKFRNKVCLITEKFAKKLEQDPFYQGYISLYGLRFHVIGVFRERISSMGNLEVSDYSALIPLSIMRYFLSTDTLDTIHVSAKIMDKVPQTAEAIRSLLLSLHHNRSVYQVDTLVSYLKAADKITLGLTLVLLVIAGISLISSGISIMNIMLITVTERTKEIGIKKAIGAYRRVLLTEFLVEALILSCGGGLAGVFLGVAVPYSIRFFTTAIQIQIPVLAVVVGFSITLLIGLIFGMIPALRASRMNPVEALRYE